MSETEFASYADDSTPCIASANVDDVIKILKNDFIRNFISFKWFSDNQMKQIKISATSLLVTMNTSP